LNATLQRHQTEIQRNKSAWENKPVLREIYAGFYERIARQIDRSIPGRILEIGSGIGHLKSRLPEALSSDVFFNPWLDVVGDAYEIPFAGGTMSHLVLFDVFHHLEAPKCFLKEARRVLTEKGRLILFEPYISRCSFPVYRWLHPEPVAWRQPINLAETLPRPRAYYAAQGNATRLFFRRESPAALEGWTIVHAEAIASFSYLFSGGFSKPCFYPVSRLPWLQRLDQRLSRRPKAFGARCLVVLTPAR